MKLGVNISSEILGGSYWQDINREILSQIYWYVDAAIWQECENQTEGEISYPIKQNI